MKDYNVQVKPEASNIGTLYRVHVQSNELEDDWQSKPYSCRKLAKDVAKNTLSCLEAPAGLMSFAIFKRVKK